MKDMIEYFTDAEAKEIGVKRELLNDWSDLMQALWAAAIVFFEGMGRPKMLLPKNGENEILLGDTYTIRAVFCNDDFVECSLYKKDIQLADLRFNGDVNPICKSIFLIIKSDLPPQRGK